MTRREPALRLIIAYKLGRAVLAGLAGVTLLVLLALGFEESLQGVVARLHEHAVSALALTLSAVLVSAVEPKHALLVCTALILDGAVTFAEGWGLLRGWRWAPWLVVGASMVLLPFEVAALIAHPSAARVALLLVNLAIVVWLVWRRRARAPDEGGR